MQEPQEYLITGPDVPDAVFSVDAPQFIGGGGHGKWIGKLLL